MDRPSGSDVAQTCFWDNPDEAWRTLYDVLYRTVRRRGIPDQDAPSLVSEAIEAHQRRFPALRDRSKPVAYARTILRNRIADWYRSRYQQPLTVELESLETSVFHQTERLLAYREEEQQRILIQEVEAAMAPLPERDKQVINLHFWEDLTFPEIATRLDESEAAVKARFYRALPRIKDEVLRNDIC